MRSWDLQQILNILPLNLPLKAAMVRQLVVVTSVISLLLVNGTLGASNANEVQKRASVQPSGGLGVWGHIYCDPSYVPGLSISLNGISLGSATLLPALPPRGPSGGPPRGEGVPSWPAVLPAAEFRLPALLPGAYLLEINHLDLIFPKYRVIISNNSNSSEGVSFEVYGLNEYLVPSTTVPLPLPLRVGPVGVPKYVVIPGGFSIFDFLRQPLVILVLVFLAIMFFLPKMQEAQMQEERQQQQQQHPIEDPCYSNGSESLFVEKLVRSIRS